MSQILRRQFLAHVGQTSPSPLMIEVARAEGVFFYTPEGRRYYDLIAGVSVSNVGHANPDVVAAVQCQAAEYMHVMVYGELVERPQVQFATRLSELLGLECVYFVNSGAEAIEGAIKTARLHTHRDTVLKMRHAYHGSSHGPMSADARLTFNDFESLNVIDDHTACVVVEPVQGEAGVRLPDMEGMAALRKRCSDAGALLVFDEVQTGMGRTGTMFAMQQIESFGIRPDIVCMAKAIGGGMPLGAFAANRDVMGALQDPPLGYINTFGGHPVCCAAGLAALNYLEQHRLVEQVESKGELYEQLLRDHPQVREIRRSGLLMAVELGNSEKMYRLMELFKDSGILSDWFLYCDTAFRISPPLTITEFEIRDSSRLILEALDSL